MARKKNFNFSLPAPVVDAFVAATRRFGPKRRWTACSAAWLLFLELPPRMQDAWVQRVYRADWNPDEMVALVAGAKNRAKAAEKAAQLESAPAAPASMPASAPKPHRGARASSTRSVRAAKTSRKRK